MDEASPPLAAYRFLEWGYEPGSRRLAGPAGEMRLKPLSDRLLRCLLDAPGEVLSREHLIEAVWTRREVNDEVLSRAIAELRAVIGDDARRPRFIETLSKGGYRWIAPVVRDVASPDAIARDVASAKRTWIALGAVAALVCAGLVAWHLARRNDAGADHAALAVGLLAARPLAADPKLEYDARFAGNGRVVYVRAAAGSRAGELVLIDTASLAERVLWSSDAALSDPAPSPDGREVAVLRHEPDGCSAGAGGLEWADGGDALLFTGAAADAAHAPGLVRLDRRAGTERVLTTPQIGEGAHINPRLSRDGARLVYASMREGEAQLWRPIGRISLRVTRC
jgi:DNA-binding winged helix-turn-helix (wHTH) protein